MVEPIIENILKAQGVTREGAPGLFRMEYEKLYQAITGVRVEDKMLEAADKMIRAADEQLKASGTSEKTSTTSLEEMKKIYTDQTTIWDRAKVGIKDAFIGIAQAAQDILTGKISIKDIVKGELETVGGIFTGKSMLIPTPGGFPMPVRLPEEIPSDQLPGMVKSGPQPMMPERKEGIEKKISPGVTRAGAQDFILTPGMLGEPAVNYPQEPSSKVDIRSINVDLKLNVQDKDKEYVKPEDLENLRREINEAIANSKRFRG